MKKTIAKLMAAAMLLSAVPAVTMPSFVSKAEDKAVSATSATVATNFFTVAAESAAPTTTVGNAAVASNGTVANIIFDKDVAITKAEALGTIGGYLNISYTKLTNIPGLASDQVAYQFKAAARSNMTSQDYAALLRSIKDQTNLFQLHVSATANATDQSGNAKWDAPTQGELFSRYNYRYGGTITTGNKITSGVFDADAYLNDGDVYAVPKSLTSGKNNILPEVEIWEGNKGQLKNNDALRGNTLNLNTVFIQGQEYKVIKLNSQALKEAHMKKLLIKNVTQIGKGALRKCKNVRKVNLNDKNKVRKIRSKAFYDCKNLKHINIDGRKLKEVGKDAFGKVKKNCVIKIKASKSKYNEDVKKIKKSGAKNVKFARLNP
jgi:hypothetical protein